MADLLIKNIEIPEHLKNKWLHLRAYIRVDNNGHYSIDNVHLFSEEEGYPLMSKKGKHGKDRKTQN